MSGNLGVQGGDLRRPVQCVPGCKNEAITGYVFSVYLKCPKDIEKAKTHARVCPLFAPEYERICKLPWVQYTKKKRTKGGMVKTGDAGWGQRGKCITVPGCAEPMLFDADTSFQNLTIDQLMINMNTNFAEWLMDHNVVHELRRLPTKLEFKLDTLRTLYAMFISVKGEKIVNFDFTQLGETFQVVLATVDDSEFEESESEGASPSPIKRVRMEPLTTPTAPITQEQFVAGIEAMERRMGTTEEHLKTILELMKDKK